MQNLRQMVDTGVDIAASSAFTGLQGGGPGSGRHATSGTLKENGWKYSHQATSGSHVYTHDSSALDKHSISVKDDGSWNHNKAQGSRGQAGPMRIARGSGSSDLSDHLTDVHKKDLDAGGAGSGCHGGDCGRKSKSSKQSSSHPKGMGEKDTPLVKRVKSNVAESRIYHEPKNTKYHVYVNEYANGKEPAKSFKKLESVDYYSGARNPKVARDIQRSSKKIAENIARFAADEGHDSFNQRSEIKQFYHHSPFRASIEAGGAGSGCHGGNCGRPSKSHAGAGHKGGSVVRPGERKALERQATGNVSRGHGVNRLARGKFRDDDHRDAHTYAGRAISVARKLGESATVNKLTRLQNHLKSGGTLTGTKYPNMVDTLANKHFSKSENLQEKANRMREGRGDSRESKRLDKTSSLHEQVYNHLNDLQDMID